MSDSSAFRGRAIPRSGETGFASTTLSGGGRAETTSIADQPQRRVLEPDLGIVHSTARTNQYVLIGSSGRQDLRSTGKDWGEHITPKAVFGRPIGWLVPLSDHAGSRSIIRRGSHFTDIIAASWYICGKLGQNGRRHRLNAAKRG